MYKYSESIGGIHREIMKRCYNPKSHIFQYYGAKGITVCEEWQNRDNFREWSLENGYKQGLRLNRKDSSKGYCPENCYWGEGNKAKHGYSELVKTRAKANKERKAEIGLKRLNDSPLASTYRSMKCRCENKNHKHFKHYGGRGITVCDEWRGKDGFYNFLEWAKTSGWQPGLTLDRKDVNKGYSPENCHWATRKEQANNKRNSVLYAYKGLTMNMSDIAKLEKVSAWSLRYRVSKKGMSVEDAVKEIKQKKGEKK